MTTAAAHPDQTRAGGPAPRVPRLGGLNPTLVRIEVLRVARNARTLAFAVVMPVAIYFAFGGSGGLGRQAVGRGNVAAYSMISMALYGAMTVAVMTAASVSVERAQGWSRQLRLTPLRPQAYVAVKAFTALLTSLLPVVAVNAVGLLSGATMPSDVWVLSMLLEWFGAAVLAAFGLFMGYLLPTENSMQFLGLGLALMAFAGGVFYPFYLMDPILQEVARFTPMWGPSMVAHAVLLGDAFDWVWALNICAWLAVFATGAGLMFRRDTRRV
ncbi:ABC transporter permease [Sinomonas sp. P10A9]|uniref:ABC transporter permease n=1 Tax=Sinomonas puerhi TaxID=3238584 RepID=A0AB39L985_9MICC